MEIERIDEYNMLTQLRDEIIQKGEFARIELVANSKYNIPFIQVQLKECDIETIAFVLNCLESIKEDLCKDYPEAQLFSKLVKLKTVGIVEESEGNNDSKKM